MRITKSQILDLVREELALVEDEKWAQKAAKDVEEKGTEGEFTKYCDGDVDQACVDRAARGKSTKRKRQAAFAANINSHDNLVYPKKKKNESRSVTKDVLRKMIKEEAQEMRRHLEGEKLLRKFYAMHEGETPTWDELKSLADRMGLHDDAVGDAMGLAGHGPVHSDS